MRSVKKKQWNFSDKKCFICFKYMEIWQNGFCANDLLVIPICIISDIGIAEYFLIFKGRYVIR